MIRRAFTLIEILVVVAIIAILLAILLPALEKSNERARITVCGQNLHQVAIGLRTYANDFNNLIPLGSATPSSLAPARNVNTIGNNQLWIASTRRLNGLGILTNGSWVTDPRIFVCPSDDDKTLKSQITNAMGGPVDVYGSYAYRQLDQRSTPTLDNPGMNIAQHPARALVLDWQSDGPAPFTHNSHDHGEYLNILYNDGHIQFFPNDDHAFGAIKADYANLPTSYLHRLDQIWVTADWAESNPISTAPKIP